MGIGGDFSLNEFVRALAFTGGGWIVNGSGDRAGPGCAERFRDNREGGGRIGIPDGLGLKGVNVSDVVGAGWFDIVVGIRDGFGSFNVRVPASVDRVADRTLSTVLAGMIITGRCYIITLYRGRDLFNIVGDGMDAIRIVPVVTGIDGRSTRLVNVGRVSGVVVSHSALRHNCRLCLGRGILDPRFIGGCVAGSARLAHSVAINAFKRGRKCAGKRGI